MCRQKSNREWLLTVRTEVQSLSTRTLTGRCETGNNQIHGGVRILHARRGCRHRGTSADRTGAARIAASRDKEVNVDAIIDVQCPYCGKVQKQMANGIQLGTNVLKLALCDPDDDGCDKNFAYRVHLVPEVESTGLVKQI